MAKEEPPLSVDCWVDVILAGTAHRSSHESHGKFGQDLLHRYFTDLPDRYKDDKMASRYFDEMIPAVASAIRGFSVVRDVFQTNTETIRKTKDLEIKHLEHLDSMSPLNKEGIWGRILVLLGALGLIAPIQSALKSDVTHATQAWLFAGAASIALSVIGFELFIQWLRKSQAKKIEMSFPEDVYAKWQEQSIQDYQKLIMQFIRKAIGITNKLYPAQLKIENLEEYCNETVGRHLALNEQK